MQQMFGRAVVGVRRPGHQNHGEVFGISAADSIDCGKPADAESHDRRRGTARPSIALRGVATIQLVATNLFQFLVLQKLIKQNQIKVTRNREVMLQTYL
jgi:hypothetical protein